MEEKDAELKKLKETLKDINEQDRILKGNYFIKITLFDTSLSYAFC